MDYILFVAQDANFQSRSMLIPADKFLYSRKDDYEILRNNASPHIFTVNNIVYNIDNLIIHRMVKTEEDSLVTENTDISRVLNNLSHFADFRDEYDGSEDWFNDAITCLCTGFNHLKNYVDLRNLKSYNGIDINIINGFLILESFDA